MTVDMLATFARQAAAALWRARRLYAGAVLALAVVLVLVGGAVVGRANLDAVAALARSRAAISAYLSPSTTPATAARDAAALGRLPGVRSVRYVDAAAALAQMRLVLGPSAAVLRDLGGENPFSPYLAISVVPGRAGAVARSARHEPGVAWVQDDATVLARLDLLIRLAEAAGWALILIAGLVAVVVTAYVIRLSMWARRQDMVTLRWLGASPAFVAAPFVLEGLMVGAAGGLLAMGLLLAVRIWAGPAMRELVPFLPWRFDAGVFWAGAWTILALALGCALLGSLVAVRSASDRLGEA